MFQFDRAKLDTITAKVRELTAELFPKDASGMNEFVMHAVIANLIRSENDMKWMHDHYYAPKWAAVVPEMVRLYGELVKHGHDASNEYEISSCDRYASFIPKDDAKVLYFRNQNMSYLVVVKPGSTLIEDESVKDGYRRDVSYKMHVRVLTNGDRWSDDRPVQNHSAEDLDPDILAGCASDRFDNKASKYFRYQDGRDQGYIITLNPSLLSKKEVFYTVEDSQYAHKCHRAILDELEAYASMMNHTVAELNGEEYDESED